MHHSPSRSVSFTVQYQHVSLTVVQNKTSNIHIYTRVPWHSWPMVWYVPQLLDHSFKLCMHFLWGEEKATIEKNAHLSWKMFWIQKIHKPVSESSHCTESDFACKTKLLSFYTRQTSCIIKNLSVMSLIQNYNIHNDRYLCNYACTSKIWNAELWLVLIQFYIVVFLLRLRKWIYNPLLIMHQVI